MRNNVRCFCLVVTLFFAAAAPSAAIRTKSKRNAAGVADMLNAKGDDDAASVFEVVPTRVPNSEASVVAPILLTPAPVVPSRRRSFKLSIDKPTLRGEGLRSPSVASVRTAPRAFIGRNCSCGDGLEIAMPCSVDDDVICADRRTHAAGSIQMVQVVVRFSNMDPRKMDEYAIRGALARLTGVDMRDVVVTAVSHYGDPVNKSTKSPPILRGVQEEEDSIFV